MFRRSLAPKGAKRIQNNAINISPRWGEGKGRKLTVSVTRFLPTAPAACPFGIKAGRSALDTRVRK